MQESDWLRAFLEKVSECSPEGRAAVNYIRAHRTGIGFRRARRSVGAFWTLPGNILLNSFHYDNESVLRNPRAWTLLIHEVRHLEQGWLTALSVYGELDAWQCEFRAFQRITERPLHPIINEILSIPLDWDRSNLRRARTLMQTFAGKGYRADLLPLYPLHKEIRYWLNPGKPV